MVGGEGGGSRREVCEIRGFFKTYLLNHQGLTEKKNIWIDLDKWNTLSG